MPSNNQLVFKPAVRSAWGSGADSTALVDPETATPGFTAAGWPLSSQPPARQYWNWILNYCMNGVRYFCRRGIPDWDTAETYFVTDVVQFGGIVYQSLQSNNSGNAPASSPSFWGGLQGYVLSGQLNNYVTTGQLATTLANYVTNPALSSALANYTTLTNLASSESSTLGQAEAYTNSALANYVTSGTLSATLANYASLGYVNGTFWPASYISANFYTAAAVNSILGSYYTAAQVNSLLGSYYTAAQVNSIIAGYYSAAQVNSLVANYLPVSTWNAGFAASNTANGYQRLPSGAIMQWGLVNASGGSSGTTFNFNVPFQSAASVGFINGRIPRSNGNLVTFDVVSGSQAIIYIYNGGTVNWFAIGF